MDRQVIFQEAIPIYGNCTEFAFERPIDINDTPGIWWISYWETASGQIAASHLREALEWCEERFGKNFEPYKAEFAFAPKRP